VRLASYEEEYGVPMSVSGSRAWSRICSAATERIGSAAHYVAVCRRLSHRLPSEGLPRLEGEGRVDGRLVATAWNHVPPREWILGDRRDGREPTRLVDFLSWWEQTQGRPEIVGSSYNGDPDLAFRLWTRARWAAEQIPAAHWHLLFCRDGRINRVAVRHAAAIGRALRRSSMTQEISGRCSLVVLRRLGQLCPELQRVALRTVPERCMIRIRHLDWEGVARYASALRRDGTGRVRAALAYRDRESRFGLVVARRFWSLVPETRRCQMSTWLCPSYPGTTTTQAAALALGQSPAQISGGVLTRSEAHRWLSEEPTLEPLEFLTLRLGVRVRSIAVAHWLLDVDRRGAWSAMTRQRTAHGPGGVTLQFAYLDRVDEIQDPDLAGGSRTSVDAAFRSAAQRAGESWLRAARGDHRVLAGLPAGWRLYPCMRLLNTPSMLAKEGEQMGHCVGGYRDAVERGQSVIIALNVAGNRSTAELSPTGRVLQHRAFRNGEPHNLCQIVLYRFVARRTSSTYWKAQQEMRR